MAIKMASSSNRQTEERVVDDPALREMEVESVVSRQKDTTWVSPAGDQNEDQLALQQELCRSVSSTRSMTRPQSKNSKTDIKNMKATAPSGTIPSRLQQRRTSHRIIECNSKELAALQQIRRTSWHEEMLESARRPSEALRQAMSMHLLV